MEHALRSREELIRALDDSRLEELRDLHRQHRPHRRSSLLLSWLGSWLGGVERAAGEPLPTVRGGELAVTFIGHASALLRWQGASVVCDPMLGERLGVVRRAVEPGLGAADLSDVRAVLISHAHHDHLHRPTLEQLPRAAVVIVPPRTGDLVRSLGFARVAELAPGQAIGVGSIQVFACPARHPARGGRLACSYVVRGDGPSVYVCGDSGYFSGFAEVGRRHRPDVALLPIAGYVPASFRSRHMSPLDALYAFEDLGARMMIPIHHGAFALSYETLEEPLRWLRQLIRERELERWVTILRPGTSALFSG